MALVVARPSDHMVASLVEEYRVRTKVCVAPRNRRHLLSPLRCSMAGNDEGVRTKVPQSAGLTSKVVADYVIQSPAVLLRYLGPMIAEVVALSVDEVSVGVERVKLASQPGRRECAQE